MLAETLLDLGRVEERTGNFKRASELYGAALHILKKIHSYDHIAIAETYWKLARAMWGMGHLGIWADYHHECLRMLVRL